MPIFLFRKKTASSPIESDDARVTKLFFDSFSKRVSTMEEGLKKLAKDVESLHVSVDRSQISDLVLLERLQKAEATLEESLGWIKKVAEYALAETVQAGSSGLERVVIRPPPVQAPVAEPIIRTPVPLQGITVPSGQSASLQSITTPTELQVLALLSEQGPKSAPEIGRLVGRSREHSARLMKKLFQEGYVNRDQTRIPFRYSAVERVRASFKKAEKKEEQHQEAAAPA